MTAAEEATDPQLLIGMRVAFKDGAYGTGTVTREHLMHHSDPEGSRWWFSWPGRRVYVVGFDGGKVLSVTVGDLKVIETAVK